MYVVAATPEALGTVYVTKTKDPSALMDGMGAEAAGEEGVPIGVTVTTAGDLSPVPVVETDRVVVLTLVRVTTTVSPLSPELTSEMILLNAVWELPRVGDSDPEVIGGSVSVTVRGPSLIDPVALADSEGPVRVAADVVAIGSKDSMVVSDSGEPKLLAEADGLVAPVAGEEGVKNSVEVLSVDSSARGEACK